VRVHADGGVHPRVFRREVDAPLRLLGVGGQVEDDLHAGGPGPLQDRVAIRRERFRAAQVGMTVDEQGLTSR